MNTPAHVVFSLALLGGYRASKYAVAIAIGAILPDLPMLVFYAWEKLRGVPEHIIWDQHYFLPMWQNIFDIPNSIPLVLVALSVCIVLKQPLLSCVLGSMLIHCLLDLPVHHDDSHRHFYPLTDFRFASPLSYWDRDHFGHWVSIFEQIAFVAGAGYLWWFENSALVKWYTLTRLRIVTLLTSIIYLGFMVFVAYTWADL